MFNFTRVLNASTRERYYISSAKLMNDDIPAEDGTGWYEIDLQPEDIYGKPLYHLDLSVCDNGEVYITKNLNTGERYERDGDGSRDNPYVTKTTRCMVEGKTLVISNE